MPFPGDRSFAFTILDDTDDSTLENVAPVYDRLREYGFRTTKTVWPLDCPEGSDNYFAADTLQRGDYLAYVKQLVADGFELASHGATMESSDRERTLRGLAFLDQHLDERPRLHANHGENRENVYWGAARFRTPPLRWLARRLQGLPSDHFRGEVEGTEHFWGDVCRERFRYVRNFTFADLDVLAFDADTPYRCAETPFVDRWFSTTDAPDAATFVRRVTPGAIDRLEASGGVCILSTHLGKGFAVDGAVDPRVDECLRYIADKPGWFAPVSTILDYLAAERGDTPIGRRALARLELRFWMGQLRERFSGT